MSIWDLQPRKLAFVYFSFLLMCGGRDKLGVPDFEGEDSQERSCTLKICYRLPVMLLTADLGAVFLLLPPLSGPTKAIIRDLEIPRVCWQ